MAIVMIVQPPVSRETYEAVSAKVDAEGNPPPGLILHCAGDVDGKLQIIEVWESEEQSQRFGEERLGPAIAEVAGADGPSREEAIVMSYEVHTVVAP